MAHNSRDCSNYINCIWSSKELIMDNLYNNIPNMTIKDLESELNFYQWLIDKSSELGGIEMKHRIWLDSVKIEVKRRGYQIEKKLVLIEPPSTKEWDYYETLKKI